LAKNVRKLEMYLNIAVLSEIFGNTFGRALINVIYWCEIFNGSCAESDVQLSMIGNRKR